MHTIIGLILFLAHGYLCLAMESEEQSPIADYRAIAENQKRNWPKQFKQQDLDEFFNIAKQHPDFLKIIRLTGPDFYRPNKQLTDEETRRAEILMAFIKEALIGREHDRPSFDVFFSLEEIPLSYIDVDPDVHTQIVNLASIVPWFVPCVNPDYELARKGVLFPDYFLINPKTLDEIERLLTAGNLKPFTARENKIFWRGTLSGHNLSNVGEIKNPRLKLMLLAREYRCVDAKLISSSFVCDVYCKEVKEYLEANIGPAVDFFKHAQNKYLFCGEGFGAAWARLACALATGSVVLLQTHSSQFFYSLLKPWVHFVPISDDLSNLIEAYAYLEEHPELALEIGRNGRQFAMHYLNKRAIQEYMACILP